MKKIVISTLSLLTGMVAQAQVLYNNGATVLINTGATVRVNGNLVNNTGTLTNNGTLTATGNITNNTAINTPGTGVLQLNGTAAQTLSGTSPVVAGNIVMNNAAGVTLATPLRINGTATFTSGLITATSSTSPLVFTANGTVSGTPTNASHVNGFVVKEGPGSFDYPVGNTTNYQKTTVNLNANSAGMAVRYFAADGGNAPFTSSGTDPNALGGYNQREYWDISPRGTATGTVTIYWDGYNDAYGNTKSTRRVAHKINGGWQNEGTIGTGNEQVGQVISNTISAWSPFALGSTAAILPLTWLQVTATLKDESKATINWQVQEQRVKLYTLERSTDGRSFSAVTTIPSQGNGKHTYHYTDAAAFAGNQQAYYRILQQDVDGAISYSKTVQVSTVKAASLSIYPTPFHTSFVVYSALAQPCTITATGGKIIATLQLKAGTNTIPGQNWATGTYYLTTQNGETYKLLKN